MSVVISGTGLFTPEEHITNEELVHSFNDYVAKYNEDNKDLIASGGSEALVPSSSEFIKKASNFKIVPSNLTYFSKTKTRHPRHRRTINVCGNDGREMVSGAGVK